EEELHLAVVEALLLFSIELARLVIPSGAEPSVDPLRIAFAAALADMLTVPADAFLAAAVALDIDHARADRCPAGVRPFDCGAIGHQCALASLSLRSASARSRCSLSQ